MKDHHKLKTHRWDAMTPQKKMARLVVRLVKPSIMRQLQTRSALSLLDPTLTTRV